MKIHKISVLLAFLFVLPSLGACAGKKSEAEALKAKNESAAFKSTREWNKLDGRFKHAWEKAMKVGDDSRPFECLIKMDKKITTSDKKTLSDAGYALRSLTGRIATGSVTAEDVPDVAALPFVQIMELAVPLSPKK